MRWPPEGGPSAWSRCESPSVVAHAEDEPLHRDRPIWSVLEYTFYGLPRLARRTRVEQSASPRFRIKKSDSLRRTPERPCAIRFIQVLLAISFDLSDLLHAWFAPLFELV
jgi:hypothetical protein